MFNSNLKVLACSQLHSTPSPTVKGHGLGLWGFFLGNLEGSVLAVALTCTHSVGLNKELHRPDGPKLDFSSTRTHTKE